MRRLTEVICSKAPTVQKQGAKADISSAISQSLFDKFESSAVGSLYVVLCYSLLPRQGRSNVSFALMLVVDVLCRL